MSDIPDFARRRFRKAFRRLRVTDVYSPDTGWERAPRNMHFTSGVARQLLAAGTTQVRLRNRGEKHDVSILEASLLRPVTELSAILEEPAPPQ
jgi:hypothetical protein